MRQISFSDIEYGMKCHAGVDAGSGYVHSLEFTAANIHDITKASKLIRDDDEAVYGDMSIGKQESLGALGVI